MLKQTNSPLSEDEILLAIRSGDANSAFRLLYQNEVLKSYMHRLMQQYKSVSITEDDLFSGTMMELRKMLVKGKGPQVGKLIPYIKGIARNRLLGHLKKEKPALFTSLSENTEFLLDTVTLDPETLIVQEEQNETTVKAIERLRELIVSLGEKCKKIIMASWEGPINMDFAKKVEAPNPDAAKSKLKRCRKRLMELAQKDPALQSYHQFLH